MKQHIYNALFILVGALLAVGGLTMLFTLTPAPWGLIVVLPTLFFAWWVLFASEIVKKKYNQALVKPSNKIELVKYYNYRGEARWRVQRVKHYLVTGFLPFSYSYKVESANLIKSDFTTSTYSPDASWDAFEDTARTAFKNAIKNEEMLEKYLNNTQEVVESVSV